LIRRCGPDRDDLVTSARVDDQQAIALKRT
jgi:hypothetical protein